MRLLQRLRKKKPAKKFYVEIAFPGHTVAIVYDKHTAPAAILRAYALWELDNEKTFSLTQYLRAIKRIELSVKHGG